MVTWKSVEKKYTKTVADKMRKSPYLQGITCKLTKTGEVDIPERDIDLAYRWLTKQKIGVEEWD